MNRLSAEQNVLLFCKFLRVITSRILVICFSSPCNATVIFLPLFFKEAESCFLFGGVTTTDTDVLGPVRQGVVLMQCTGRIWKTGT
jgi:hypothetical protein